MNLKSCTAVCEHLPAGSNNIRSGINDRIIIAESLRGKSRQRRQPSMYIQSLLVPLHQLHGIDDNHVVLDLSVKYTLS